VGPKHQIISITLLTPLTEETTELNHIFYNLAAGCKMVWWAPEESGEAIHRTGFSMSSFKLSQGLSVDIPPLMLIESRPQSRWYP